MRDSATPPPPSSPPASPLRAVLCFLHEWAGLQRFAVRFPHPRPGRFLRDLRGSVESPGG